MQKEIEMEYKYLIGQEKFKELLSKCNNMYSFVDRKLQVNYYYDTKNNVLNKSKTTVRVRQHHDKMKLQIKRHKTEEGSLAVSNEYSDSMAILPSAMRISDANETVYLKGVLITERTSYSFGNTGTICFDENMYLGVCDYEIEIEINENENKEALLVINHLKLKQKSIRNKSSRFFERLEAMGDIEL